MIYYLVEILYPPYEEESGEVILKTEDLEEAKKAARKEQRMLNMFDTNGRCVTLDKYIDDELIETIQFMEK